MPLAITFKADVEGSLELLGCLLLAVTLTWGAHIAILKYGSRIASRRWSKVLIVQLLIGNISRLVIIYWDFLDLKGEFTLLQLNLLTIFISLTINLIVHSIVELILTRAMRSELQLENSELRYAKLQAEFQMLKEQINPHFLFNALNISKSLIREDPAEAEKYIINLSEFLRASVRQHGATTTLAEDLELGLNYMAIQMVRFEKALFYYEDVHYEQLKRHIPYFSITTLIENVIKHNVMTVEDPVTIYIYSEEDSLVVLNNVRQRTSTEGTGTGLSNLRERVRLLTGSPAEVLHQNNEFSVKIRLIPA
jgi:LytS/YehU family sensor histidine kinase